jgi:site-specific DNA-methyltransferase (adenine-specific)
MINEVLHGDCLEVLKTFPDNYFDSLITDPPSSISFMSMKWDDDKGGMLNWINWLSEVMNEAMRTMKPGAIGLVWSIPRTSHWTGMALELAGFRIIDVIHSAFGQGFPKGQDCSKMIDRLLGEEREVTGISRKMGTNAFGILNDDNWQPKEIVFETKSSSELAKQWDGWKTPALKPAIEGWWLVQKKCSESSIVRNILKHGTGGLNIEAGRIGNEKRLNQQKDFRPIHGNKFGSGAYLPNLGQKEATGRYPANLILSCGINCQENNHAKDCPVNLFPETSVAGNIRESELGTKGMFKPGKVFTNPKIEGDTGGSAARYFKQLPFDTDTVNSIYYKAKASTTDRNCKGLVNNDHPTVKSRHLMAYFIKLITPPNGIVLDPFGGSGTTAVSAIETGFNYVLIEKEEEYLNIINQRISATKSKIEQLELTTN